MTKPATGKYSQKPYQCRECKAEKEVGTNHWGEIYDFCPTCQGLTVWECNEAIPEGFTVPKPWNIIKLGDIAKIHEKTNEES